MHRPGAAFFGDPDDALDVQVALGSFGGPYEVRPVGEAHVHRALVRLRVDGHGGYAELAAGPDHAYRHLPAVGDEQLLERRLVQSHDSRHAGSRFSRKAPRPSWPSSPVRSSAMRRAVISVAFSESASRSSRRRAFVAARASGPPASSPATFSWTM